MADEILVTRCSGGAFAIVHGTINGAPVEVAKRGGRVVLVNTRTAETIPGEVPVVLAEAYERAAKESREYHDSNIAD